MKENSTKLKKKEIKATLIQGIEKILKIKEDDKKLKKVRKAIRNAANQISKRYLNKIQKHRSAALTHEKPIKETDRKNQLLRDKTKSKKKEEETPAL